MKNKIRQDQQDGQDLSRSPDESGKVLSRCAAELSATWAHCAAGTGSSAIPSGESWKKSC